MAIPPITTTPPGINPTGPTTQPPIPPSQFGLPPPFYSSPTISGDTGMNPMINKSPSPWMKLAGGGGK